MVWKTLTFHEFCKVDLIFFFCCIFFFFKSSYTEIRIRSVKYQYIGSLRAMFFCYNYNQVIFRFLCAETIPRTNLGKYKTIWLLAVNYILLKIINVKVLQAVNAFVDSHNHITSQFSRFDITRFGGHIYWTGRGITVMTITVSFAGAQHCEIIIRNWAKASIQT